MTKKDEEQKYREMETEKSAKMWRCVVVCGGVWRCVVWCGVCIGVWWVWWGVVGCCLHQLSSVHA